MGRLHPMDIFNRTCRYGRARCNHLPIPAAEGASCQIPKCPMCLDKMDMSVSGLPMSLCAHTQFGMQAWESCGCVSNWPGILCRLCAIIDRSV